MRSLTLSNNFTAVLHQKHFPLVDTFKIQFLPKRTGSMTTGSRSEDNLLKVLTKGRMNRDILRTLAHEWVHEYQRAVLNRKHGPDIGGKNEDEANAEAGKLMKIEYFDIYFWVAFIISYLALMKVPSNQSKVNNWIGTALVSMFGFILFPIYLYAAYKAMIQAAPTDTE